MITVKARVLYKSGNSIDITITAENESALPDFEWTNEEEGARLTHVEWHNSQIMPNPTFFGLTNVEALYVTSDSRYPEL